MVKIALHMIGPGSVEARPIDGRKNRQGAMATFISTISRMHEELTMVIPGID
jgi:hypothetical protein